MTIAARTRNRIRVSSAPCISPFAHIRIYNDATLALDTDVRIWGRKNKNFEAAVISGARCLGWPSCWTWRTNRSLGLLRGAVVRPMAGLAVGEVNELWSSRVVPLGLLRAREASSSLVLTSEVLVAYVLAFPTEVPARLKNPTVNYTHKRWKIIPLTHIFVSLT